MASLCHSLWRYDLRRGWGCFLCLRVLCILVCLSVCAPAYLGTRRVGSARRGRQTHKRASGQADAQTDERADGRATWHLPRHPILFRQGSKRQLAPFLVASWSLARLNCAPSELRRVCCR